MSKRNKTHPVVLRRTGAGNSPERYIKAAVPGDVWPGSVQWELEGSFEGVERLKKAENLESEDQRSSACAHHLPAWLWTNHLLRISLSSSVKLRHFCFTYHTGLLKIKVRQFQILNPGDKLSTNNKPHSDIRVYKSNSRMLMECLIWGEGIHKMSPLKFISATYWQ